MFYFYKFIIIIKHIFIIKIKHIKMFIPLHYSEGGHITPPQSGGGGGEGGILYIFIYLNLII